MMPRKTFRLIAVAMFVLAAGATSATAQIPDEFKNLQVLPKDISKEDLVATMRSFASGLGVRCNHCHVGEPGGGLRGMDFATDEKQEKKTARAMMGMVHEINTTLIPKAGIDNPVSVKCATCHHGVTRPESMADLCKREFEEGGLEAVKTRYLALKDEYYGADAYSFKPGPLNSVAEWLSGDKKDHEAAIGIMQFNIEQNPDVGYCYNLLGRIQAEAGHKDEAIVKQLQSNE